MGAKAEAGSYTQMRMPGPVAESDRARLTELDNAPTHVSRVANVEELALHSRRTLGLARISLTGRCYRRKRLSLPLATDQCRGSPPHRGD
jgi:hypothetical protein